MNFKEFSQLPIEEAEKYVSGIDDEAELFKLAADGIEDLRKLAKEHQGTPLGVIMNDFLELTEKEFKALKDLSDTLEETEKEFKALKDLSDTLEELDEGTN